jgi:sortase A
MRNYDGFERLLLFFGLLLLAAYFSTRFYSILYTTAALQRFSQSAQPNTNLLNVPAPDGITTDFSFWSEKRIEHYKASLSATSLKPLAVLQIPALQLRVPVLAGTDDLTLDRGVGHIEGTPGPGSDGNIGIAGHRDGFFRSLQNIHTGDAIELILEHNTNTYAVDETLVVPPEDVSVLGPREKPSLTLVTCYPFYFVGSAPKRFIVHASILSASSVKQPIQPGREVSNSAQSEVSHMVSE